MSHDGDLNNLNSLPLNIACESTMSVPTSEEDNMNVDICEENVLDKAQEKQNFRDILQDRVLRRLQEKMEYGKKNIDVSNPKRVEREGRSIRHEEIWKRVEGRVAAKKADLRNSPSLESQKAGKSVKSDSSEDIKTRIRSMSKAMGLASNIQNQMKSGSQGEVSKPLKKNIATVPDFLSPSTRLEQSSSVYEETLSQGRFMEDDYFSLPSVGSTNSLFSNISEYKVFVSDREDALAAYLRQHSNILDDKEEEVQPLTELKIMQYMSQLSEQMKATSPEPLEMSSPATPTNQTPRASPIDYTPRSDLTVISACSSPSDLTPCSSPTDLTPSPSPRESSKETGLCIDSPADKSATQNDLFEEHDVLMKEQSPDKNESGSVSFSDANCQTSLVFESREDLESSGASDETVIFNRVLSPSPSCDTTSSRFQQERSATTQFDNDRNFGRSAKDIMLRNLAESSILKSESLETTDSAPYFPGHITANTTQLSVDAASELQGGPDSSFGGKANECVDISGRDPDNLTASFVLASGSTVLSRQFLSPRVNIVTPASTGGLSCSGHPQITEEAGCTTINIPVANSLETSNIQVKVNFWSGEDTITSLGDQENHSPEHDRHHDHGRLVCTSIPVFEEEQVDKILKSIHIQDEEKREKMRKLLEELDQEYFLNSFSKDLSGESLGVMRAVDDNVATNEAIIPSRVVITPLHDMITPSRDVITPSLGIINHGTGPVAPPDYFSPFFLQDSPEYPTLSGGDSCPSLPSVPSFFDSDTDTIPDTGNSDLHRYGVNQPNCDILGELNNEYLEALNGQISDKLSCLDAESHVTSADSVSSCDTIVLNSTLQSDLHSKASQTLALPFRLVKFLPIENYGSSSLFDHVMGSLFEKGNCGVGVQVDMNQIERIHNARQELSLLDHETRRNVKLIDRRVAA